MNDLHLQFALALEELRSKVAQLDIRVQTVEKERDLYKKQLQ